MSFTPPVLGDSRFVRFSAFTMFYVAQGIPIGVLDIAMPAWLAGQGYSAVQVGSFVAIVGLPWAFKLVAGPFMDRFGFPAMGRRRPWVMLAQTGLMLMLGVLALVPDPVSQFGLIMAAGFAVNCFAATQDVAVDGMAIDVLPFEERGRVNAFMAFGQVSGVAGMGALSGYLLANFGLLVTGLVAAVAVLLILMMVIAFRERQGERFLPWTEGQAHPSAAPLSVSLFGLFGDLRRALILPMSLVITASVFTVRVSMGMFLACAPVFAVQKLGFASATYSETYGILIGLAALSGLVIGPIIDRIGAKKVMMTALCVGAAMQIGFGLFESMWHSQIYLLGMLAGYLLVEQVIFIAIIAQYMNLTWEKVAATQFAVYMALANLGRSSGSALFATMSLSFDFSEIFISIGAMLLISAGLLWFFSQVQHLKSLERLVAAESLDAGPVAGTEAS